MGSSSFHFNYSGTKLSGPVMHRWNVVVCTNTSNQRSSRQSLQDFCGLGMVFPPRSFSICKPFGHFSKNSSEGRQGVQPTFSTIDASGENHYETPKFSKQKRFRIPSHVLFIQNLKLYRRVQARTNSSLRFHNFIKSTWTTWCISVKEVC